MNPPDDLPAVAPSDVQALAGFVLAPNTLRAYTYALRRFDGWVEQNAVDVTVPTEAVISYLLSLDMAGKKTATIDLHRSACEYRYGEQLDIRVRRAMGAIKRRRAARLVGEERSPGVAGNSSTPIPGVTLKELRALASVPVRDIITARDRAMILLGFFGAFRRSELIAVRVEDITVDGNAATVVVQKSKGDQHGQGRTKYVIRRKDELCPVRAIEEWMRLSGIRSGFIFRPVYRDRVVNRDMPMLSRGVTLRLKRMGKLAGFDPKRIDRLASHGLRRGWATAANRAGVALPAIKLQGWRSETVMRYIETENPLVEYEKI